MIAIPYTALTVKEAVYLMERTGGYCNGDREAVVIDIEGGDEE